MKTKFEEKKERARKANDLIAYFGSRGRMFFNHSGKISHMEVDERGRIWFINAYNGKRIYTHYNGRWRGFGEGGTLRDLIIRLRDYIQTGKDIGKMLGPFPDWYSNGDPWGYKEDMELVYIKALELGIAVEG